MKLQFENRVYDILKWLCLIALPAASVLYSALAGVYGPRWRLGNGSVFSSYVVRPALNLDMSKIQYALV